MYIEFLSVYEEDISSNDLMDEFLRLKNEGLIEEFYYILHNKDKYLTGENKGKIKKPHYHIIIETKPFDTNHTSVEKWCKAVFANSILFEKCKNLSFKCIKSFKAALEYFCHLSSKDRLKHRYKKSEIVGSNQDTIDNVIDNHDLSIEEIAEQEEQAYRRFLRVLAENERYILKIGTMFVYEAMYPYCKLGRKDYRDLKAMLFDIFQDSGIITKGYSCRFVWGEEISPSTFTIDWFLKSIKEYEEGLNNNSSSQFIEENEELVEEIETKVVEEPSSFKSEYERLVENSIIKQDPKLNKEVFEIIANNHRDKEEQEILKSNRRLSRKEEKAKQLDKNMKLVI